MEYDDLEDSLLDALIAEWQALPEGATPSLVPPWEQDWILASCWPPWFSTAIWDWCRALQWQEQPVRGCLADGAAHIELDKARRPDPWTIPEGPRTVRQLTYTVVEATGQLSRLSGVALWSPRHRKVYSLRRLHQHRPFCGVSARPLWPETKTTYTVLRQVLAKQSTGPLEDFSRRHCRPLDAAGRDIVARHASFSSAWREQHAKWL